MIETIPEGASRTFRCRVPDGRGGFKNLTGYSFTGYVKTAPDTTPVATLNGGIDPDDVTSGLVDLQPSHTTGRGGLKFQLELEASNGSNVHVAIGTLIVVNR